MNKEKIIKNIIKEFFEKMESDEIPEKITIKDDLISFEIQTKDPQILIGKRGQILINIQHVLSRIINKQLGERFFIDFDINQYKKNKTDYLREIAESLADEVVFTKKTKALPPMSSFERRIIHLALSSREGIITQSEGEEPDRRVVVRITNH